MIGPDQGRFYPNLALKFASAPAAALPPQSAERLCLSVGEHYYFVRLGLNIWRRSLSIIKRASPVRRSLTALCGGRAAAHLMPAIEALLYVEGLCDQALLLEQIDRVRAGSRAG